MSGYQKKIFPLSATTQTAFEIFLALDIMFEVIYIDAAHDFLAVQQDLFYAFNLLVKSSNSESTSSVQRDGLICGDDYQTWSSVSRAVNDFCNRHSVGVWIGENSWIIADFLEETRKESVESSLTDRGFTRHFPHSDFQSDSDENFIQYLKSEIEILMRQNRLMNQKLGLFYNSLIYNFYRRIRPFILPIINRKYRR